jgi:hypothetical protein
MLSCSAADWNFFFFFSPDVFMLRKFVRSSLLLKLTSFLVELCVFVEVLVA